MAVLLDPRTIYNRGLADFDSLVGAERLVFMLQDFDIIMEMEGWDHYFLYESHFAKYSEMKEWLRRLSDGASLAVLSDYESHVRSNGFDFSPNGIEAMLGPMGDEYFSNCPDWRGDYCDLRQTRWAKAIGYLASHGLTLQTH